VEGKRWSVICGERMDVGSGVWRSVGRRGWRVRRAGGG